MNQFKELVKTLRFKIRNIKRGKKKNLKMMPPPKTKYCYRYDENMVEQCEVCEYCPDPEENRFNITHRSNVVQLDELGYPLRLCIIKKGRKTDQVWIDTVDREGDVVLEWEECIKDKKGAK